MSINTVAESLPSAMESLIECLGADVTRFEATVYHIAGQLTVDYPEESLTRYRGGSWALESIRTEDGASYWWRLESESRFSYLNAMNGCEETVDAELLSMAVNLIATSSLCIWHFQRGNEHLNHAYAVLHEGLKQYCLDGLQADEHRLGQLLSMID